MSTLIAYASKYGFTKSCAETLAKMLAGEVVICDLGKDLPDLAKFEKVVIGGSVYMGKIRRPVAKFCLKNILILKQKKLGLFICGIAGEDDAAKEIVSSFPEDLLSSAVAKEFFGGELDLNKLGPFMRLIMKNSPVQTDYHMKEDSIDRLAEAMNKT